MKPNGLRIGNYVAIRNVKFNFDYLNYVVEIGDGDVLLACNEEAERFPMVDIVGESLTEELLIYMGFARETEQGFGISYYKDGLRLYLVTGPGISNIFFYEAWYSDNHENTALINSRVDCVHVLQNLFYALKEQELLITPNK